MLLHLPGVKASLLDGISIQLMIKLEKLTPSAQIMGQKGAECHKGTTRVPDALQLRIQYCAKVMQTIIDEYRDISAIFKEILP